MREKEAREKMSTKLKKPKRKRKTRQVRISENLHRMLKLESKDCSKTISKLVDEFVAPYLLRSKKKKKYQIS